MRPAFSGAATVIFTPRVEPMPVWGNERFRFLAPATNQTEARTPRSNHGTRKECLNSYVTRTFVT